MSSVESISATSTGTANPPPATTVDITARTTTARVPRTAYTGAAIITAGSQTVTAYELPGTTGIGVINGSTLSYGGPAVTLADGAVLSLGQGGIVGSQSTFAFTSTSVLACPVPVSRTKSLRPYTGASGKSTGGALSSTPTQSQTPSGSQAGASSPVSTGAAPRTGLSTLHAIVWTLAIAGTFII